MRIRISLVLRSSIKLVSRRSSPVSSAKALHLETVSHSLRVRFRVTFQVLISVDESFINHLKSLSPSSADLELRSLSATSDSSANELLHFIKALTVRLQERRDYELTQVWMTVFLRLHSDEVMQSQELLDALKEWKGYQEKECGRLDGLVGYCSGVVSFLRSPRT
jgi:hypothetical protein